MRKRALLVALGLAFIGAGPVWAQGHEGHGSQEAGHEGMHAAAPTEGLRAELIADVEQLESKYMGLARAMSDHFAWRPAEGVRSVGEVFGHVAGANFMIPSMAGAMMPQSMGATMQEGMRASQALERSGDAARILSELEHSFRHVKHAIADVSDAQLEDGVKMFGRDATKRQVLTLLVTHMHEHLGQAIAYARVNGVTPPWSN